MWRPCVGLWLSLTACTGTAAPAAHPPADHHPGETSGHESVASQDPDHAYVHAGRAHHRFDDPEAWAKRFEDPSRDAWQRPQEVLAALALEPTSVVADIGSASGYFPVRIAPQVPEGRVWGVDIEPAMVRYLNRRARDEGFESLFSILGTEADPLLPEPVDAVLMVNTYHHVVDRHAYFQNLGASLKTGGRLVIVDFKLGEQPVGPPDAMKVAPDTLERELAAAGYELVSRDDDRLPYQHLWTFKLAER